PALTIFGTLTRLRLTRYDVCAITLSPWSIRTTCQPPSPSGTSNDVLTEPSAAAVVVPSGTETVCQHVPVQFTRLPTTVAQSSDTGLPGWSPVAETPTFVLTALLAELSFIATPLGASE